jgi:hypothetical protein
MAASNLGPAFFNWSQRIKNVRGQQNTCISAHREEVLAKIQLGLEGLTACYKEDPESAQGLR